MRAHSEQRQMQSFEMSERRKVSVVITTSHTKESMASRCSKGTRGGVEGDG